MTARVLIAEDEEPARAKIKRLLSEDPRFELAGEARDGVEAMRMIEELRPDVVFLDVQMPGLDGFETLDALGAHRDFVVIFSTAHDEHALRAFDANALDYLLKPYDGRRFHAALEKAARQLEGSRRAPRSTASNASARVSRRSLSSWMRAGSCACTAARSSASTPSCATNPAPAATAS